jgi:hypothetical protein
MRGRPTAAGTGARRTRIRCARRRTLEALSAILPQELVRSRCRDDAQPDTAGSDQRMVAMRWWPNGRGADIGTAV